MLNVADKKTKKKLLKAIKSNDMELVKSLLEKGSIDLKEYDESSKLMVELMKNGYNKMVELLIVQDITLDTEEVNNFQVLMYASYYGYEEIIRLLLEKGADSNVKDIEGTTPLILASDKGHREVVKLLLKSEVNVDAKKISGATALTSASQNDHVEVVKLLLTSKADLDIKDKMGNTSLMVASFNGNKKIVQLLLELNPDIDTKNKTGTSALMLASENNHKEIVKLLLKSNANPNITNNDNWSALTWAASKGSVEVVKVLLESGSDVNKEEKKGWTPLMLASNNGYIEVVKLLLNFNADPNTQLESGWTALMLASKKGYKEIVTILLEKGTDYNIKNDNGTTALIIALENGHEEVVKLLSNWKSVSEVKDKKTNGDFNFGIEKKGFVEQEKKSLKIEIPLDEEKKVFVVKKFFKSYFSKRLDKEKFEAFLYEKGLEILKNKNYRSLCHGYRVKKLKFENNFFELRINSGDRLIFTFKDEGIIFLCVDNHDKAIERGKNTAIGGLMELSARVEDIYEVDTNELLETPVFEYGSVEEIEQAYEESRELYKLTEEQQRIVNQKLPICLYGSAGSGKTTMLLKKIERVLRDNESTKILFLTHNKRLLKHTKELYETYSGYKLNQINFKDINGFFREELSIIEDNSFSFEEFRIWFDERVNYNVKLKKLSVIEVFSEIKGIIKGFVGTAGKRDIKIESVISKEYYIELRKKYSLLKEEDDRKLVYSLALEYEKYLKKNNFYDENDLATKYIREDTKNSEYDLLVCDEVQDLTEVQLLGVLKAVKDKKNVFLTGDNNQAINLLFFDFSRLKTLYHENYNYKDIKNSQISINQRSSKKIVELAKKISNLREGVLPSNKRVTYREEAIVSGGNMPILAPFNTKELSQLENKDITVIVPNLEMKKEISKYYDNTVLTVYESKGLERENIICIGLVEYFKDDLTEVIKSLENSGMKKLSNHYRHFFNLFYVATTRAKSTLIFLDNIENKFFNQLEEYVYKSQNGYWLDNLNDINNMSDEKLLKYAKEFERNGLYSEALKNYKKIKGINAKYILRVKSFINYEAKDYEKALKGFDNLEMWSECLECTKKLKDEGKIISYQIKIYEKDKNYLSLAELYCLESKLQSAFNSYINYFREEEVETQEDFTKFFEILPKVKYKDIEEADKRFVIDNLSKLSGFYKLAVDLLVIDKRYEEAKKMLELQSKKNITDRLNIFLLKSNGELWKNGFDGLRLDGEKILYKNYYLDTDLSELNTEILKGFSVENLDLFMKNGFIGELEEVGDEFIEQILEQDKKALINCYLIKNSNKKKYEDTIEKYLKKCIEKETGKKLLEKSNHLLDEPYSFLLKFSENDKIKNLINNQLKSGEIGFDIFKKSYKNLIEFETYVKIRSMGICNNNFIFESLDFSSLELEELIMNGMNHELEKILRKGQKLLVREAFEKLNKEEKEKYGEYYIPYIEEQVNTKVTVFNLSKEKKSLKLNGKHLKEIVPMTKILIDLTDNLIITLGDEERKVTLEDVVLGKDKIIFK